MAQDQSSSAITSAFPAPPPYYKSFNPENIDALRTYLQASDRPPLKDKQIFPITGDLSRLRDLPDTLENLIPPPLPIDGRYTTFGIEHGPEPLSLDDQVNRAQCNQKDMLGLIHRIMLKFLEIIHILSITPSSSVFGPAWDDLESLLQSLNRGINAWRSHQDREALAKIMEQQIKSLNAESDAIEVATTQCRNTFKELSNLAERYPPAPDDDEEQVSGPVKPDQGRNELDAAKAQEQEIWKLIESKVGRG